MKKFLLILSLVVCVFGMTACGAKEETKNGLSSDPAQIEAVAGSMFNDLMQGILTGDIESAGNQLAAQFSIDPKVYIADCYALSDALAEMGGYEGIVEGTGEIEGTVKEYTMRLQIKGSKRNADVEIYFTEETAATGYPSIMISPQYTMGEKMTKAAQNTLLGMGTVFLVLILIMLIIYAFGIIPKIEKSMAEKKAAKAGTTEAAVDNTIAQIIQKEELSDDTELVAVIAAAIAASEGAAGTDGFVVRSIKRANTNKWQRA